MSFLLTLDDSRLEEIVSHLERYERLISEAEPIFKLENRRLEEIARTLPHYQASYDQAFQEVRALDEWLSNIKEKTVSKYWKKYVEAYPRQLAQRDIQAYIAGEREIVEINQLLIEVTLVKNKLSAIVEALKQLGWMVSNITKLRISEMHDAVL